MYERSDRIALFDHYAACLGPVTRNWNMRTIPKEELRVFGFDGAPEPGCSVLCTFGLSDHCLHAPGARDGARLEYLFSVSAACDAGKIAALLLAIGAHALEKRYSPGVHGVLEGKGAVLFEGNPRFEHFYLASPIGLPTDLAVCGTVAPSTGIVQLIPVSSEEKRFIDTRGWQAFERLLRTARVDLSLFDGREEVVA